MTSSAHGSLPSAAATQPANQHQSRAPATRLFSPPHIRWHETNPSDLVPDGCEVHVLARPTDDAAAALEALAEAVDAPPDTAVLQPSRRPDLPTGPLTPRGIADILGNLLPEEAIVSDEGNTAGAYALRSTAGAPRHDWLFLTGGAIGQGLPVALGAAVARSTGV